ncbi:MAG: DNA polymerase IV [Chloroflexi bacterium]|nr:DNA polymerase IV [Chloroflexota bacterium]
MTAGPSRPRRIAHFDLDSFFVAVERVLNPDLIGKPVLVGYAGGRGVVASASYEARTFGCHSAQPMGQALRLCPQAIVVTPEHGRYGEFSERFHAILADVTPFIESAGMDEAYADLTGVGDPLNGAAEAASLVRRRVREEVGLAVSVCIAGSKTTAKVGSDRAKPDGLIEVPIDGDAAFLAPLRIRELPMVGPKMGEALLAAGIRTIGDIAALDPRWLSLTFGKGGEALADRARGIDPSPILTGRAHRQISRENTFAEDVTDDATLRRTLHRHAERVGADLRRQGRRARTISLRVRWPDFTTVARSRTLPRPVQSTADVAEAAERLLEEVFRQEGRHPVRLIGVAASNLVDDEMQLTLDDLASADGSPTACRQPLRPRVLRDEALDHTLDALRERFGDGSVARGTAVRRGTGDGPRNLA